MLTSAASWVRSAATAKPTSLTRFSSIYAFSSSAACSLPSSTSTSSMSSTTPWCARRRRTGRSSSVHGGAPPGPTRSRTELRRATIASLDQEGRGVARDNGKVAFVDGALPGEEVEFRVWQRKPRYDLASVVRVMREGSARVTPPCPHYDRCGGCSLQHLDPGAQVANKQRVLEEALARIGKVEPQMLLSPIHGTSLGYRHRARWSARHVAGKNGVLVGFRERRAHFVVDMDSCAVLPGRTSDLIAPLREMIGSLELAARIPQIDVAVTDTHMCLTLRILDAMGDNDRAKVREFARVHALDIYLQPAGLDSVRPLDAE